MIHIEKLIEAQNQSAKFLKIFTQDQIDQLAQISPKCDLKNNRWGDYSLWIVSKAGKSIKFGKKTFDQIIQFKDQIQLDIEAFDQHKKDIKVTNIDTYKTFGELHDAMKPFIDNGKVIPKTVTSQMSNRARTAYQRMKQDGMDLVYESPDWLVTTPTTMEANEKMSSVGKWCHTGDVGYWNTYTSGGPLYYILNKKYGFCLCMSYWRQKEIRNQFDYQPQKKSFDSNDWELYVDENHVKRDHSLEYDNSEEQWQQFFTWLDKTEKLKQSILKYEENYDKKLLEIYQKELSNNLEVFKKSIASDGALIVDNDIAEKLNEVFTAQGMLPEPDEEDFEDEDEFNAEYDRIDEINNGRVDEFHKFVEPLVEKFLKDNIKVIRFTEDFKSKIVTNNYARYFLQDVNYSKSLPAFDMQNVKIADHMFANCQLNKIPELINTENIQSAKFMFYKCINANSIEKVDLPNCIDASNMFVNTSIKEIGYLNLEKCQKYDTVFSTRMHIKRMDISNVINPLKMFGLTDYLTPTIDIDEIKFNEDFLKNIKIGNMLGDIHINPYQLWRLQYNNSPLLKKILDIALPKYFQSLKKDVNGLIEYNDDLLIPFVKKYAKGIDISKLNDQKQAYVIEDNFLLFREQNIQVGRSAYENSFSYNLLRYLAYGKEYALTRYEFTGKILIKELDGDVTELPMSKIRERIFKIENPEGQLKIKTTRDAIDFKVKAYGQHGLLHSINMVDIRDWDANAQSEMNLWLFIHNIIPYDAEDIPYIKVTKDQYKYREEEKHYIRTGEDDYDVDYETLDLFDSHPQLAKKYGRYGYGCEKFIVQDKLDESIEVLSFSDFIKNKSKK